MPGVLRSLSGAWSNAGLLHQSALGRHRLTTRTILFLRIRNGSHSPGQAMYLQFTPIALNVLPIPGSFTGSAEIMP